MERIGRYNIVRELGRGAMGVVYHAIDPNIGRPVAIKTIQLGTGRRPEEIERMRERLFREARSAGMLSHPGIVTIYDVSHQDDLAYIAMEFVDGPTLDQVMSEPQPMPADRMFSNLAQTAVALDYAHSKGIVHRDVKPANIMIAKDGTTKITDFGIAKIATSESLTMTGSIVGTPHYMSPEQVQGQTVTGRSDQFSLAVIAYELLTGEKPYAGEHLTTVVYKIVAEEPILPHRINPSLSGAIESVIRKALAKRPDARYATCSEFVDALEKACSSTKGWKLMPRGGVLDAPTAADVVIPVAAAAPKSALPAARSAPSAVGTATLPPPRRARNNDATATASGARKSNFVPFLMAVFVAGALLALIGWQIIPGLGNGLGIASKTAAEPVKKQEPTPPVVADTPKQTAPDLAADKKPSPVGPAASALPAEIPGEAPPAKPENVPAKEETAPRPERRTPVVVRAAAPQEVQVSSSPAGATATLDGDAANACKTPCRLTAAPGRHSVSITMPGYQIERREVTVGTAPTEMMPILLRAAGGTLMLSSDPPGATILVDGKKIDHVTPAQIPLPLGTYTVVLEKDGQKITQRVEITSGINYRKIVIGQ